MLRAALLPLLAVSCDRHQVQSYRVPKEPVATETAAPAAAPLAPDGTAAARQAPGRPQWTPPATWQEAKPGPMQLARFSADDEGGRRAEVTVVPLPGDAGGTLANVNRWRSQLGLDPVTEADLPKLRVALEVPGTQAMAVDLVATNAARRMIAAAVAVGNHTWFYKLVGDETVVAREKAGFLAFVRTVKYLSLIHI